MGEIGQRATTFLSLCGGNCNSSLFFLSLHVSLPSFLKISGPLFLFTHPHPSSLAPIYPASPPNPFFFVTSFRREVIREIQQRGLSTDEELGKEFMSLFSVNCLWVGARFKRKSNVASEDEKRGQGVGRSIFT